ncbi:hypothetical protein BDW59DRAFT_142390 [Aspergillus cavernicola]|uniref:Uncharacterized protein n=1 Tax=Aspergillus cavernicola TaxID=176166 RepID=A0ABR4IQS7_9EURO
MVALRRFFQAEKAPSTPISGDRDLSTLSTLSAHSPPGRTPSSGSSQPLNENEHFYNLERQFEVMHDQLKSRPMSPPSHIPLSRASSRLTTKNPRHVDLLDALFSSHRYQMQSPGLMSPITPYNEDVAERNMAPFLRPRGGRTRNAYKRIVSALYQEDVADRNIAQNRRRSRSLSRSTTRSRLTTSHSYQLNYQHGDSRGKESQLVNSISQEALYSAPKSFRDKVVSDSRDSSPSGNWLRTQRSAPTVLSEQASTSRGSASHTERHLGVPPAHKQGETWSNTPLPDSPTLPMVTHVKRSLNERRKQQDAPAARAPSPRMPSTPKGQELPISPRVGSKKNVRDLSINTELAIRGRPKKIVHRAIQPPTPSTHDMNKNPSIAEVMNSPLHVATPISSPLQSSNQKAAEIMDMFRKAYSSTQAITPHPTFETLQDAIIREINSHEAFQRVPIPEAGLPFTPSHYELCDETASPPKPVALKDGQLSKLIHKSSFKKHRRGSEARKSTSTSIPSNIFRRTSDAASRTPSRRRHTDAPLPSPGFFDTMNPQPFIPSQDPVTYMDLILQSENSANTKRNRTTSVTGRSGSRSTSTPSVLCMRAQTSLCVNDSPRSFAADDNDSDIIHLPSISSIPHLQIQGVDENNVTYLAENTTPRTAYRLMNWPRKSSRTLSLRNSFAKGRTTSGQSVESY